MCIQMLMIPEEISLLSGQQQLHQAFIVLYTKSQCVVSEFCSSHFTLLQCIFYLYFIWLFHPVVSFCKFLWLIRFLGGPFVVKPHSLDEWDFVWISGGWWHLKRRSMKMLQVANLKWQGKNNWCSDFSPLAVSSQWVWRDHFQLASVLCQLHLSVIHHLRPFCFCKFYCPFQRKT